MNAWKQKYAFVDVAICFFVYFGDLFAEQSILYNFINTQFSLNLMKGNPRFQLILFSRMF